MVEGLAEADARIDRDALASDPRAFKRERAIEQEVADLGHDVGVGRLLLHRARLAEHVHDNEARIARDGGVHHGRIRKAAYVVDYARPSLDTGGGDVGMSRIHRDRDAELGRQS